MVVLFKYELDSKLKLKLIKIEDNGEKQYTVKLVAFSGGYEVPLIDEKFKEFNRASNRFQDIEDDIKQLMGY
nr:MAG TPA: hypothetical protein [Caudoviricetes sp.]